MVRILPGGRVAELCMRGGGGKGRAMMKEPLCRWSVRSGVETAWRAKGETLAHGWMGLLRAALSDG